LRFFGGFAAGGLAFARGPNEPAARLVGLLEAMRHCQAAGKAMMAVLRGNSRCVSKPAI
jgi:hypothetical protein